MRRILVLILLSLPFISYSQSKYYIRTDTLVVEKTGGSAEFLLRNATRDTTGGVLQNIGGGRTRFIKIRAINDSAFIVGLDTVVIRGATGGGSGTDNTNTGIFYRWLNAATQGLRTAAPDFGMLIDSVTNANALTFRVDTAAFSKTVLIEEYGADLIYASPVIAGQDDTIHIAADTFEVSSSFATYDSVRVAYDLINSRPILLMGINDSIVFSGGATVIRIPTNGNILIVAEGRSNPIDFTSANLYYWIWDGRIAQFMGRLFPNGYIDEPEEAAASLYLAPNGTIQVIFAGYLSDGDNSFYRSELTVNPSTNVITPSGSPTLIKNFTTFALLNNHRVIRASTGRYYLPYSIFISGSTTSLNDASSVYNGKLMVSDNGMTWRETSTTIYSPDSLVAEPGIYESDVTLSDPKGSSTGKLVYYYRNRRATASPPGTIYYTEANLSNDTAYSQYLAMGIDVPNSPLAVISYKKRLYAIHNKWMTNATNQDEVRKEMVISVGHEGEQLLNTRIRVAGNEVDSMATTAPIIWVDSVTSNIFAFYTDLQQTSGRGQFWMKRYDIDITEPPTQDRITTLSTLDVIGGANIATGTDREFFRIYSNTRQKVNGYFSIGNGISSQYQFLPQLTFVTDQSIGALGAYFKSFVGSDANSSMYSAAFVFDGFTPAAGTLANAPIATFISNGNMKFSVFPDNRIVLTGRAGDPSTVSDGSAWYNTSTGKFRVRENGVTKDWVGSGGGSYTFAESLVDNAGTVTLVNDDPAPGAYKFYGFNASSVIGYHSPSLDYNSDVDIASPQNDQALIYHSATTNWRNAYVVRPDGGTLTSGTIPIATANRFIGNSALTFDAVNGWDFGANKITLTNVLRIQSGTGINSFISWDAGGIFGTSSNHIMEFWTNSTKWAHLSTTGNWVYNAGKYLNWGTTEGSSGYGFRDNSGVMEFKNSGGSWAAFGAGVGTLQTVTDAGATTTNNVTFNGTGASIISTAGTSGIVAAGSSFGGEFSSTAGQPILISNSSTTAGVRPAIHIQRNASYTGAANDGLQIRFDAKNSADANKNYALIDAILTTATASSEVGAIQFKLMDAGAAAATKFTMNGSGLFEAVSLKTANPTGGTSGTWKLGSVVTTTGLVLSSTTYIQVDIGGTLYRLAVVDLP